MSGLKGESRKTDRTGIHDQRTRTQQRDESLKDFFFTLLSTHEFRHAKISYQRPDWKHQHHDSSFTTIQEGSEFDPEASRCEAAKHIRLIENRVQLQLHHRIIPQYHWHRTSNNSRRNSHLHAPQTTNHLPSAGHAPLLHPALHSGTATLPHLLSPSSHWLQVLSPIGGTEPTILSEGGGCAPLWEVREWTRLQ